MTEYVIQAVAFANGTPCPHAGQYLKSFDFEFENGLGYGEFTRSRQEAMRFKTVADAMQFWRTESKIRPLRPDGEPNRPLTALTVHIDGVGGGDDGADGTERGFDFGDRWYG